jgi:hypothetical protein
VLNMLNRTNEYKRRVDAPHRRADRPIHQRSAERIPPSRRPSVCRCSSDS